MLMLQHKHIVSLYEVLESEDNVFFVMELCGGGSLYEYMGNKPLSEDTARYYFSQIIEGVSYSHAMVSPYRLAKIITHKVDVMTMLTHIFRRGLCTVT